MSATPENSSVDPTELPLFLLISAEFDGELSPAEDAELRTLQERFPEQARVFRAHCQRLRSDLQKLPVAPAGLRLKYSPPRHHQLDNLDAVAAGDPARRAGKFRLRLSAWRIRAIAAAVLACGLVLISARLPFFDRIQTESPGERSVASLATAPSSSVDAGAESPLRTFESAPFPSALPGASAFPMATTAAPVPAADVMQSTASESLQTLLAEDDWKVVVVRVRRGGPEDVLNGLRSVLSRHGLQLAQSQPAMMPEWLGVCLPASGPAHQNLLDEVQKGLTVDPPEWDPAEVMRSSREAILQAVRQSLSSPTQSELIRGEVFVAVSSETAERSIDPAYARDRASDAGAVASAAGTPSGNPLTPQAAKESQTAGQPAMLLVFDFTENAGGAGPRRIF
jgi:hypothetical protein